MPDAARRPPPELAECTRLEASGGWDAPWRRWGPYLSERQWGTVREDYSQDGNAWAHFPHDHARSRAYHWGEDGLAGFSDLKQRLCFALALWNGKDPILKERLFGLTNAEGNHGEDVKEYYWYLDSTPTHSYMKWQYKYPQCAFPYDDLVATNARRTRQDFEYELIDSGVFDDDRYFDVFVEYAKSSPEECFIRITVANRGPETATIHLLPTLWFRNTWRWWPETEKPHLAAAKGTGGTSVVTASHQELGDRWLHCDGAPPLLFTENDTNTERLFNTPNASPYVKDAFHACVVNGNTDAVNPAQVGTKAAAHYRLEVGAGQSVAVRLCLTDAPPASRPFAAFERTVEARRREADEFYRFHTPESATEDVARVMRQAFGGLFWTKQYYFFDVNMWLREHDVHPFRSPVSVAVRNRHWFHMFNDDIISMPDKWEYPWYAAWDLAFHAVALAGVDPDFAKHQLNLMLKARYQHANGQLPAYEWNFGDVNPPVHAWATLVQYRVEQARRGEGDLDFLKRAFGKLLINFTWWVNRKDRFGKSVFEGGFLGLDNIGVFDRSAELPTGGHLEQADGTAWMAMFCQNMLEIAVELTAHDESYDQLAYKFAEHFLWIGAAMNTVGHDGMWDEEDGFYYDVLRLPDGSAARLKVRSLVGLLPLCATTVIEPSQRAGVPRVVKQIRMRLGHIPELLGGVHPTGPDHMNAEGRTIAAVVDGHRLRRILSRMLDEEEFLSPYGIRSVSRWHEQHPYVMAVDGKEYQVSYQPAESQSGMFGGNSNWRGPVWVPINTLLIRALFQFHAYYGDAFRVECPTGSGRLMTLLEVANEICNRLQRIFLREPSTQSAGSGQARSGQEGRRPVFGGVEKFQTDPHWRDCIPFYEYFHGDNGAGLGASHQTGWTALAAGLAQIHVTVDAVTVFESARNGIVARGPVVATEGS
jgi:Mannosylglycerate hydrolase MGH1-like glycoside hydrolase domain